MFPEEDGNKFVAAVADKKPQIRVEFDNDGVKKAVDPEILILDEFVEVMGVKAKGKKLSNHPVAGITWLEPVPVEEEEIEEELPEEDEVYAEEPDESEEPENEVDLPKPNPPDFPDDDDPGTGIQMTLF